MRSKFHTGNQIAIIPAVVLALIFCTSNSSAESISYCSELLYPAGIFIQRDSGFEIETDVVKAVGDTMFLHGNVEIRDSDRNIRADQVIYDRQRQTIEASGNVHHENSLQQFESESFSEDMNRDSIVADQVRFKRFNSGSEQSVRELDLRGEAEHMEAEDGVMELYNAVVTNCPEGNQDVTISSPEVVLDSNTRQGRARNATIRARNIPIFYFPYLRFPIGEGRMSGFLLPTLENSSKHGTVIGVPYYFNLAPNYDATVNTQLMSKRGVKFQAEFRHLGVASNTMLQTSIIPHDREHGAERSRYGYRLDYRWHDGESLFAGVDVDWVSDSEYLDDFAGIFENDSDFLQQNFYAGITENNYKVTMGTNRFIITDPRIMEMDRPHNRMPWATVDHSWSLGSGTVLDSNLKYDKFEHDFGLSAERYRFDNTLNLYRAASFGSLNFQIGSEYVDYRFTSAGVEEPAEIPISSEYYAVEGKLFFDRVENEGDSAYRITLEPRVSFVSSPDVNQADLPNFDTSIATIDNYEDLFGRSQYIGSDRVTDTRRISAGLSLTMRDQTDASRNGMVGIGRIFYPKGANLSLDSRNESETHKSDLFIGGAMRNSAWATDAGLLYDDQENVINQSNLKITYRISENGKFSAVYRYLRNNYEKIGAALSMNLGSAWKMNAQHIYSLTDDRSIKSTLGFQYSSCCWGHEIRITRELDDYGNVDKSVFFYVRLFEL